MEDEVSLGTGRFRATVVGAVTRGDFVVAAVEAAQGQRESRVAGAVRQDVLHTARSPGWVDAALGVAFVVGAKVVQVRECTTPIVSACARLVILRLLHA